MNRYRRFVCRDDDLVARWLPKKPTMVPQDRLVKSRD